MCFEDKSHKLRLEGQEERSLGPLGTEHPIVLLPAFLHGRNKPLCCLRHYALGPLTHTARMRPETLSVGLLPYPLCHAQCRDRVTIQHTFVNK